MFTMFTRHACMHAYVNRFNKYPSWSRGIITCVRRMIGELIMRLKIVLSRRVAVELTSCVCDVTAKIGKVHKQNALCLTHVDSGSTRDFLLSPFLFHLWLEDNFQSVFRLWQTSLVCLSFISLMERRKKCINIYNTLLWDAHIYISCASLWGELGSTCRWCEKKNVK